MTIQTPVAKDDPLMIAWEKYKASPEFAKARTLAQHMDGSLWVAFCTGRQSAADIDPARTPNTALPHLVTTDERRRMVVNVSVSADFQNRLDNQWEVEREIHADRWSWQWAEEAEKTYKHRLFDAVREAILEFPMPHGRENALLTDLVEHVLKALATAQPEPPK